MAVTTPGAFQVGTRIACPGLGTHPAGAATNPKRSPAATFPDSHETWTATSGARATKGSGTLVPAQLGTLQDGPAGMGQAIYFIHLGRQAAGPMDQGPVSTLLTAVTPGVLAHPGADPARIANVRGPAVG